MADNFIFAGRPPFARIEAVEKGWSSDKKFRAWGDSGEEYLIRRADAGEAAAKKAEFEMMERVHALGVPMSRPLAFTADATRVLSLFSWCPGQDAEAALPAMTPGESYALGQEAGRILRVIHSVPAPAAAPPWGQYFRGKTARKIKAYAACPIKFDGDSRIIQYLEGNAHLPEGRPLCLHHGDYHVGNMIVSPHGALQIIDFNRWDYGDPWEEFNRIVWSAAASPHFATGQLDGYFGGRPPMDFFRLLAYYIGSNTLSSVPWAIPFGQGEVDTMLAQARDVLDWFCNMENPVPSWYIPGLCRQPPL